MQETNDKGKKLRRGDMLYRDVIYIRGTWRNVGAKLNTGQRLSMYSM